VLIALLPISFLISKHFENVQETIMIMIMAWVYNDLGAANENFHLRNPANALGMAAFNAGAATPGLNGKGYVWLGVLGASICSTISILDMPDIARDSARGRRTMPIVCGHEVARWGLAIPIVLWSVVCPVFLGTGFAGFVFSVFLGIDPRLSFVDLSDSCCG
jgi:4-hydroxybenzoate polyprenyltransferase